MHTIWYRKNVKIRQMETFSLQNLKYHAKITPHFYILVLCLEYRYVQSFLSFRIQRYLSPLPSLLPDPALFILVYSISTFITKLQCKFSSHDSSAIALPKPPKPSNLSNTMICYFVLIFLDISCAFSPWLASGNSLCRFGF